MLEMPNCLQIGATSAVVSSRAIVSDLAPFMKSNSPSRRAETTPPEDGTVVDATSPPRGIVASTTGSSCSPFFVLDGRVKAAALGWKLRASVYDTKATVVAKATRVGFIITVSEEKGGGDGC